MMKGSIRLPASLPNSSPAQKPSAVPFTVSITGTTGKPYRERPERRMSMRSKMFIRRPDRKLLLPEEDISHIGDVRALRSSEERQRLKKKPQNIHVRIMNSEKNNVDFRRKRSEDMKSVIVSNSAMLYTSCFLNDMRRSDTRCP
jgi:hypothetical protein